jgi:HEPN domain-containing protein
MIPEPELTKAVSQWLDKAAQNLRARTIILENDATLGGLAAFHAQQAAEKYLKALLTWRQIAFTKTHDIGFLLELLGRGDPALVEALRQTIKLTILRSMLAIRAIFQKFLKRAPKIP